MNEFVGVVQGSGTVSSEQALRVFELLCAVVTDAPDPAEAVRSSAATIARMERDDVVAVVLDWWLTMTAACTPPLGHAFNLPESIPQPLRDAMASVTLLAHQRLPLPPAAWLVARRRLRIMLEALDGHLSLDSYGKSRLPGERPVWAYLQREMEPVIDALRQGRRAEPFVFDQRAYEREMAREAIDENSRRWNEMLKRAEECIARTNDVVAVQQQVAPWTGCPVPELVSELPATIRERLGRLAPVLLAQVLEAPADEWRADPVGEVRSALAAERLADTVAGLDDSALSWLGSLLDGWPDRAGVEAAELTAVAQRRQRLLERVDELQSADVETIEIEVLLEDHDLDGAEAQLEVMEAQRRASRRSAVLTSTIARFQAAAGAGPLPNQWDRDLAEAAQLLEAGHHEEAAAAVQILDRELKRVRRAGAVDELQQVRDELDRFGAPTSLIVELDERLATYSSTPDKPVDPALVQRSQERLDSVRAQRRQEAQERLRLAGETLVSERELIQADALDDLELGLAEARSMLDDNEVMAALEQADELLANIDRQRVHRWSHTEGEEALAAHLVGFCTQQLHFDPDDVRRLLVAAKTKPFVILAGLTGSGKSTIARLFAAALGADSRNGRFRRIAVRPDWIDQSEVLGSVNPLSNRFEPGWLAEVARQCERNLDQLHVVLLDEMNLAPVEQYLAEYLSAIEEARSGSDFTTLPLYSSGATPENGAEWPSTLPFPPNLIVIGTVNIDETTRVLSERVLVVRR